MAAPRIIRPYQWFGRGSRMPCRLPHRRDERGQALIIFILAATVIFVMAAIIVDMGFWLSQRRGAQSDGDFSVLAGAQAYLSNQNNTSGAFNDAVAWAQNNGVSAAQLDGTPTPNCS